MAFGDHPLTVEVENSSPDLKIGNFSKLHSEIMVALCLQKAVYPSFMLRRNLTDIFVQINSGVCVWEGVCLSIFSHIPYGLTFFKETIYFKFILYLHKSCKNSTWSSHILLTQFPLMLSSYITRVHLSKLRNQHQYITIK